MANHKSALKAHKQSLKRAQKNRSIKQRVKTFTNSFNNILLEGNLDTARDFFRTVESEIMKSVSKGVLKLNTAARKVSRLSKKLNKLQTTV